MVYKDKKEKDIAINQAWHTLYQRLENDGLLPFEASGNPPHRSISLAGILTLVAAIAACLFSVWYFSHKTIPEDKTMLVVYNEADAPTLATMLDDGSVVYLSEQTSLKYPEHFAGDKREVVLQGEAFFEIQKQPERPFLIDTDIAGVEVTGTAFKIKSDRGAAFLLSVREGDLRVTLKSNRQTLPVKAGETVFYDSEQLQLKKTRTGFDDFITRICFKDERLANVVAIINMHLDTLQLKVDPVVADRIITFPFVINSDIIETAQVICQALDLHLSRKDHTIYISNSE